MPFSLNIRLKDILFKVKEKSNEIFQNEILCNTFYSCQEPKLPLNFIMFNRLFLYQ